MASSPRLLDGRAPLSPLDHNIGLGSRDHLSSNLASSKPPKPKTATNSTASSASTPLLQETIQRISISSYPQIHDQANRIYELISARESIYRPYIRISAKYTTPQGEEGPGGKQQALWPIFYHQNNCIFVSAQEATVDLSSTTKAIMESELHTAGHVARLVWGHQKTIETKKDLGKFWTCHISVALNDVRLVLHFWTPRNQRDWDQNREPQVRGKVVSWTEQDLPSYWTLEDWVLARVEEETAEFK